MIQTVWLDCWSFSFWTSIWWHGPYRMEIWQISEFTWSVLLFSFPVNLTCWAFSFWTSIWMAMIAMVRIIWQTYFLFHQILLLLFFFNQQRKNHNVWIGMRVNCKRNMHCRVSTKPWFVEYTHINRPLNLLWKPLIRFVCTWASISFFNIHLVLSYMLSRLILSDYGSEWYISFF